MRRGKNTNSYITAFGVKLFCTVNYFIVNRIIKIVMLKYFFFCVFWANNSKFEKSLLLFLKASDIKSKKITFEMFFLTFLLADSLQLY